MAGEAFSRKTFLSGLAGAGAITLLAACERTADLGARKEIAVSVLKSGTRGETQWKPLFDDLARQTGLGVRLVITDTYHDQVEALHGNKVQLALFADLKGAEALTRGHGEVFAEAEGLDLRQDMIVVPAESKLTAADVSKCDNRLTLAVGQAHWLPGGQAPQYGLFQLIKGDPRSCFKAVEYMRPADAVAGLLKGTFNAASLTSETLADMRQADGDTFKRIKVLATSAPLPDDALIYRRELDQVTKEKLRSFFLSYGRGANADGDRQRGILTALRIKAFNPEDNTHFIPIKRVQASLDLAEAQRGGNADEIEKARTALRKATAEQRMLDARTAPQLPADAQTGAN